jgi:predicted RecA/RadA family phage recombinase
MKKIKLQIQLATFLLFGILIGISPNTKAQQAGINWESISQGQNNNYRSIAFGNGIFVAVANTGIGNRVMTSPDGINWTTRTSAADNGWLSVTFGNGLFVAVSNTGTGNRVMTSPDGINWTIRTSAADNQWNAVTFGNGLFVAVAATGTGNRVMSSPDGINWTTRTSAADNSWQSVTFGNGLFVAVAITGTGNRVMTSPDGINWTIRLSAADNQWRSVIYENGLFVAVASSGSGNRVMTSSDGINWTSRNAAAENQWFSVTFGNGLFVAVSNTGTGNRVMTSPDGINWTSITSAADISWLSVTFGNGLFVAVSNTGTGNRVMTSPDGINWTSITSAADNQWVSVTYGNGLFVAVAMSGTGNRVMTSPDGINWTTRTSAADIFWQSVTFGNGLFVAVAISGTGNRVMTSSDGINWTSRTSAADNQWMSVTYGNGLFVAVANTGTGNRVMTSPDGINWTTRTSATDNQWMSVTYGNGLFVAVANTGTGNRVMTSSDGINWSSRTSSADNQWMSVTFGNGLFVAVATTGTGNRVMTSPDGINWTTRTSASDNQWRSVTFGNGLFVVVAISGTGNRVMTSPDGINWTTRTSAADNQWYSITFGDGRFVAVSPTGVNNRVMISQGPPCISTIPTVTSSSPASRCGPGAITISATPSLGAIEWFINPSGGAPLVSGVNYTINGNNLTINNFNTSTTFYAEAVDGPCVSATRTAVAAINNNNSTTLNHTSCGSYTLNSQTYNTSGTYTQTFTNSLGCDSTVILNLTILDFAINASSSSITCGDVSNLTVIDNHTRFGTVAKPFTSLSQVYGFPSGVYKYQLSSGLIDIQVDNDVAGGGWVMVLNYVHQGGTNPNLNILTNRLPLITSTTLGNNESADVSAWGHASNTLFAELDPKAVRFLGRTSLHSRVVHFSTTSNTVINYFKTGVGNVGSLAPFTLINQAPNAHSANIPASSNSQFSSQGDLAMTEFPFYQHSAFHWGIKGYGTRWEVDDWADNFANNTIHRVWVRGNAPANSNLPGYAWSTGGNTNAITVSPIINTSYQVTITSGNETCIINKDITVNCNTWTGNQNNNWNNANNWSNGVPTSGQDITIAAGATNYPALEVNASLNNLEIETNASLVVNTNQTLTVNGTLTNNGTITVESGGALVQGATSTLAGTGNYIVRRAVNAGQKMVGSPINNHSVSGFGITPSGTNGGQIIPQADCNATTIDPSSPYGNIMELREDASPIHNCTQSLWHVKSAGNITNARGYAINVAANTTLEFSGTINNGNISYANLGRQANLLDQPSTGQQTGGWHLVSNPYPSPIRLTDVSLGAGWDNSVYFFDGTNFVTVQLNLTNAVIPVGQAFQIRKSVEGGSANFSVTNSMREGGNPTFYAPAQLTQEHINVTLSNNQYQSKTTVYFEDGATSNFDPQFDAVKLFGAHYLPQLYTVETSALAEKLAYNALTPLYQENQQSVVMGAFTPTAGDFQLTFDGSNTVSGTVILEDKKLNTFTNITENLTYSFTTVDGDNMDRFVLHFNATPDNTSTRNKMEGTIKMFPNPSADYTTLMFPEKHPFNTINIVDLSGRTVKTFEIKNQNNALQIDTKEMNKGIYFVQILGASNTEVLKLMVK